MCLAGVLAFNRYGRQDGPATVHADPACSRPAADTGVQGLPGDWPGLDANEGIIWPSQPGRPWKRRAIPGINDDSVATSGGWTVNTKIGARTAAVTLTTLLAWARA